MIGFSTLIIISGIAIIALSFFAYKKNKKLAIFGLGLGILLFLLPFVLGIILGKGK